MIADIFEKNVSAITESFWPEIPDKGKKNRKI
jgi:hypothetical protein